MKSSSKLKCYHCGDFLSESEMVIKPIPLYTKSGIKHYKRKFHLKCLEEYLSTVEKETETKEENSEWEECYEYFKTLLNIPVGQNLDVHAVNRVLGLRIGMYYPNSNVRAIKRGYEFETILMAMKFSSMAIKQAFGTMQFQDQKHKIDYAMKIVTNNINFVFEKLEAKRKADVKLDIASKEIQNVNVAEYQTKSKVDSKVSDLINNNVKNNDVDDVMSLFD